MSFTCFYAGEEEQYIFFRFPWTLLRDERYKWVISMHAKVLYGCMLDRQQLSNRNGWIDKEGRVFIYYTLGEISYDLEVSEKKATMLLNELEEVGLIRRERQGFCKPNRIYVGKFFHLDPSDEPFRMRKNDGSGAVKMTDPEQSKERRKQNYENQNEKNQIDSLPSGKRRKDLEDYFEQRCAFTALSSEYPYRKEELNSLRELILETCESERPTIRISGEDKPAAVVRARFMKLGLEHIRYVMDALEENTTKIRDMRQYLLASIYNAPLTIVHHYRSRYNHDRATGQI